LFHLCQTPVAIYFWGGVGAAYSVAATEVFMTIIICVVPATVNSRRVVLQEIYRD
jgi:PST family polysaccharide transporter